MKRTVLLIMALLLLVGCVKISNDSDLPDEKPIENQRSVETSKKPEDKEVSEAAEPVEAKEEPIDLTRKREVKSYLDDFAYENDGLDIISFKDDYSLLGFNYINTSDEEKTSYFVADRGGKILGKFDLNYDFDDNSSDQVSIPNDFELNDGYAFNGEFLSGGLSYFKFVYFVEEEDLGGVQAFQNLLFAPNGELLFQGTYIDSQNPEDLGEIFTGCENYGPFLICDFESAESFSRKVYYIGDGKLKEIKELDGEVRIEFSYPDKYYGKNLLIYSDYIDQSTGEYMRKLLLINEDGQEIFTGKSHTFDVSKSEKANLAEYDLDAIANQSYFYTVNEDNTINIYDRNTGQLTSESLTLSNDKRFLAGNFYLMDGYGYYKDQVINNGAQLSDVAILNDNPLILIAKVRELIDSDYAYCLFKLDPNTNDLVPIMDYVRGLSSVADRHNYNPIYKINCPGDDRHGYYRVISPYGNVIFDESYCINTNPSDYGMFCISRNLQIYYAYADYEEKRLMTKDEYTNLVYEEIFKFN